MGLKSKLRLKFLDYICTRSYFSVDIEKCGEEKWKDKKFFFFFYLYIYPPDLQESDGGAIHRVSNHPDLLPEMPSYCCPLVI